MDLNDKILSALIAGVISLTVAVIAFITNRFTLRSAQKRFDSQLQRNMTEKIYDMRLEHYPTAMKITDALRRSRLSSKKVTKDYLRDVLNDIDKWHSTKAGFILSKNSLSQLYKLRDVLRHDPDKDGSYSDEIIDKIWRTKGAFRSALANDIKFLFLEDSSRRREV